VPIEALSARAFRIPTDGPEADGTLVWDATTAVVVEVSAEGKHGIGYSYTEAAAAGLVNRVLAPLVVGRDPMAVNEAWVAMLRAVRNFGLEGICAAAISAVDAALWDLKAKRLDLPLARLLGPVREKVAVYGSGGFTNYSQARLEAQLAGWVGQGIGAVKIKVGTNPAADPQRAEWARAVIGPRVDLYVDANGALDRPGALALAARFAEQGVVWFEEPVSSDDRQGLRMLRDGAPPGMAIAAGEYGYTPWYFRDMLADQAVDVLQADATRCLGITGFLQAGALCQAFGVPMSAHTAPSLHLHPCCAVPRLRNIEWFFDHVRVEQMLFDGAAQVRDGAIAPDLSRPGLGLELKEADAARWAV
jgi:L-alanine-DL-glutamate epimerase-like enolase superfamily enzyme